MDNINNIIKNLKELLLERGDNIDEFEEHEADIDEDMYKSSIVEFNTSNTTLIFALSRIIRKKILDELKSMNIESFINKYNNKNNIIIIFNNDTISTPIVKQLNMYDKMFQKKGGSLQYFQIKNLAFNPTKHELVPKHTKLSQEEVMQLMDKYLIKGKIQMPYILRSDVIAKWLGLKQGDVVKIARVNENSGVSYYYRVCV